MRLDEVEPNLGFAFFTATTVVFIDIKKKQPSAHSAGCGKKYNINIINIAGVRRSRPALYEYNVNLWVRRPRAAKDRKDEPRHHQTGWLRNRRALIRPQVNNRFHY
jgi:hypothetical protein